LGWLPPSRRLVAGAADVKAHARVLVVEFSIAIAIVVHARRLSSENFPPSGPIVESVPMRVMPMMFAAMPVQRMAFEEAPRSRESSCESSSSRLSQLEERFNLLNDRVNALQSTISVQTDILTQIKAKLDTIRP